MWRSSADKFHDSGFILRSGVRRCRRATLHRVCSAVSGVNLNASLGAAVLAAASGEPKDDPLARKVAWQEWGDLLV